MFPYYKVNISQNLNVHTYNTRGNENYRVNERARLRIIQRSYLYKGTYLWNSLESWKNDCYSISSFKKQIKTYLLDNS